MNFKKLETLFEGWEETMILSCLQECMGYAIADNESDPVSAQIVVGDFCFFAGIPDGTLAKKAAAPIIIPQNQEWKEVIQNAWGSTLKEELRYAIKKEGNCFNKEKLEAFCTSLHGEYELRQMDQELYEQAISQEWSRDLCSQFTDSSHYLSRGLGIAVLHHGTLVAGASSYTYYKEGIEIEIDTMPEYRCRGLATACGARLILECLSRNLYPSWDAHDLRSVALAEKLGYHLHKPYPILLMQ